MLRSLKKANNKWWVKLIYCLVILSFVSIGVLRFIRNLYDNRCVIKVGNQKITRIELISALANGIEHVKKTNIKLDNDSISVISDNVIEELTNSRVIEEYMKNNNMIYSFMEIEVTKNYYRNEIAKENKLKQALLYRNLVSNVKANSIKQASDLSFSLNAKVPGFIKDILVKDELCSRKFYVSKIKYSDAKIDQSSITDQDISRYYNSNMERYMTPETRDIDVLVIDINKILVDTNISDNEIRDYYDKNINEFASNEEISCKKYVFSSSSQAHDAWKMLNSGGDDNAIKKAYKIEPEIVNNIKKGNDTTYNFLLDLNPGDVSQVINVGGKYCVYVCKSVEKSTKQKFTDVKNTIKKKLIEERVINNNSYSKLNSLRNDIDDMIASDKGIDEISKLVNLPSKSINGITKDNIKTKLQNINIEEGIIDGITSKVFEYSEINKTFSIPVKNDDSTYCIVRIKAINESKLPAKMNYDQVKKDLIKKLQTTEVEKIIHEISNFNGKTLIKKLKAAGYTEEITTTKNDIKRCALYKYGQDQQNSDQEPTKAALRLHDEFSKMQNAQFINLYYGIEDYKVIYNTSVDDDCYIVIVSEQVNDNTVVNRDTNQGEYDIVDRYEQYHLSTSVVNNIKKTIKVKHNEKLIQKAVKYVSYLLN